MALGPAIEVMRQAVFRYDGYVRPRGDGIQALFGVPLSHEDHAVRGCLAALELNADIARLNSQPDRQALEPIRVRSGLNSGEIIVKRISDDLLLELDAIGATVALASRMERLAGPDTILMTAATFALAERMIRAEGRGKIDVRGVGELVEVFCLEGLRQEPVRFRHPTNGRETTFVGRALELHTLFDAWQEANRGQGQIVAFVGEPGVGKSRLMSEFVHSPHLDNVLVLEARSVSYGKATPYLPIINLLRAYFDIHTDEGTARAKAKITGKLRALDCRSTLHWAAIFDLLALGADDAAWGNQDPSQRRHALQEAILDVLLRELRNRPLCLVFEDLHWIDSETATLLDKLIEFIPTRRLLLLVNYRPEYQTDWGRKTYFRQLPVAPLSAAPAQELLDELLGLNPDLTELKTQLIDQTAGNPLFLEECVHMLRAQNILSGGRGGAQLVQPLSQTNFLPASVQSTLKARIDRLDPEHKNVLEFASVFGKDFSLVNLTAAIDLDAATLQTCLAELQALEFIHRTRREPEIEFSFKHALTYQVAYRSLLNDRRRTMHAAILYSMERRYIERGGDHAEELARHALQGHIWDKALNYAFEAGKKAFERSAHRESVQHLEDALKALQNIGERGDNRRLGVDVRFLLRSALLNLGEIERVGEVLGQTRPLVQALDVLHVTAQLEAFQSNYYCLSNDQGNAIAHGLRAINIADTIRDRALTVEMAYRIAQPYYHLAKYAEAIERLDAAIKLVAPDETHSRLGMSAMPVVVCRTWQTLCYAELGDFAQARANAAQAVELATNTGHPLSTAFAYWGQGHLYLLLRDYGGAAAVLERGLEVCQRWSLHFWFSRLASALGYARALNGDAVAAVPVIEDALNRAQARHFAVDLPRLFERLASAQLLAGQGELAHTSALQALALAAKSGARGHQAWALRLLGEIALAAKPANIEAAEQNFKQALELAVALGMRPLAAHCHEGLARLEAERGQQTRAAEYLSQAQAIWSSLER